MNTDSPLYVLVTHHSSLKGALPLLGISNRLGGLLKLSTVNNETHTHVYFFDRSIFGRVFVQVIERADTGFIASALNPTEY